MVNVGVADMLNFSDLTGSCWKLLILSLIKRLRFRSNPNVYCMSLY